MYSIDSGLRYAKDNGRIFVDLKKTEPREFVVRTGSSCGTVVPHKHRSLELLLAVDNPVVVRVNDVVDVLMPGECCFFDGVNWHSTQAVTSAFVKVNAHFFAEEMGDEVVGAIRYYGKRVWRISSDYNQIIRLLNELRQVKTDKQRVSAGRQAVAKLLHTTNTLHTKNRPLHAVVNYAIDYMLSQPYSSMGIDDLARSVYVSQGHLHYLFRKFIGCSPARLWLCIAIERICHSMVHQRESTETLAQQVGFESARGLQLAFQRVKKMSVMSYRLTVDHDIKADIGNYYFGPR